MLQIKDLMNRYDFSYVATTPSGLLQAKRGDIIILSETAVGHVGFTGKHKILTEVDFRKPNLNIEVGTPLTMVCQASPSKTIWKGLDGRGVVGPSPMFDVFDIPILRLNYLVFLSPEQPKE